MLRPEILVAGCILVLVGLGLIVFGYQAAQPTTGDQIVSFLENVSGEAAPPELKSSKEMAYGSMGGGILLVCAGLFTVLKSRSSA